MKTEKALTEDNYPKPEELTGEWRYINIIGQTMSAELISLGPVITFPQLIRSDTDWSLLLTGFKLTGTVRVNQHGQASDNCLMGNFDYYKNRYMWL